jgi:hypothetical protein
VTADRISQLEPLNSRRSAPKMTAPAFEVLDKIERRVTSRGGEMSGPGFDVGDTIVRVIVRVGP